MKLLKRLFGMTARESHHESLTGEWRGHYLQHGSQHRIIATIVQDGNRISGRMTDVDNVTEQSLYDAVAEAGLPPGTDEQIAEQIGRLIPDAAKRPITTRSILPEASTLEGTVCDQFVRFKKTYQGKCFYSYEIGDKAIDRATDGHSVEYSGRLSPDGKTISGRWTVYHPDATRGFIDGGFELQRT